MRMSKKFKVATFEPLVLADIMEAITYPDNVLEAYKGGRSEAEYCSCLGISMHQHHAFLSASQEYRQLIELAKTHAMAWWDGAARLDVKRSKKGERSCLNSTVWQSIMRGHHGLRDREIHEIIDSNVVKDIVVEWVDVPKKDKKK